LYCVYDSGSDGSCVGVWECSSDVNMFLLVQYHMTQMSALLEKRVRYMKHRVLYSTAKDLLCKRKNDDNDKKEPFRHKGSL